MSEAQRLLEEAQARNRRYSTPTPLVACTRCGRHAALSAHPNGTEFFCGMCATRASIFAMPIEPDSIFQRAADAALRETGARLDGLEPKLWQGDQA